jgi:hypothetical protein
VLPAILAGVTAGTFLVVLRTHLIHDTWGWDLLALLASILMAGRCCLPACLPARPHLSNRGV